MSTPVVTPEFLTALEMVPSLRHDAASMVATFALVQRYSDARDSFITLRRENGRFVMRDAATGAEHSIEDTAEFDRLAAHWVGFAAYYNVSR